MKPEEMLRCTPVELDRYLSGRLKKDVDNWRHTREIMAAAWNSNPYLKKRLRGKDLIPLDGDVADYVEPIDVEYIATKVEKYMNMDANGKKTILEK